MRVDACPGAVESQVCEIGGPDVGGRRNAERRHASGEPGDARHGSRVVRVHHELRVGRGTLEHLGLCVCDCFDGIEERRVHLSHVGPHPNLGFRHPHERSDFTGVVHAELDDGNLRPMTELQ